jgi:hypothetical protein
LVLWFFGSWFFDLMQLDRTRIAVRERGLLDTLDLALHVTRDFAGPLAICSLLAIVPLALLNYALVGWMAPAEVETLGDVSRYLWNMTVLIYLEAPVASIFVVAYLGPALFLEQRTVQQIAGDVLRYAPQLLLCQGLLRGLLVAWGLYLLVDRLEFNGFIEGFLMTILLLWSTAMRAFRPYINEIILLEKNPLRSRQENVITMGKRSSHLHGPYSADLLVRWVGAAAVALLLVGLALLTAVVAQGFLISDWPIVGLATPDFVWQLDWFKLQVVYPACLWLVVAFMSVVRFLSYLDLRIRHEGWEVELFMRAEAIRLAARME